MSPEAKTDEVVAQQGLDRMQNYMEELGLTMNIKALGVTQEMLPGLVQATAVMEGGYKVLSPEEILEIFKRSM